jgi:helix-turn-helix protein
VNTKPKRFLFAAGKHNASDFLLPTDTRKSKAQSGHRRALFLELAHFADADGRGAWPSAKTLAKKLGWGERTVRRYMADLMKLGFCTSRGKSKFGGSAIRDLTLPIVPDSVPAIVPDSTSIVPDSPAIVPTNGTPIVPSNGSQPALDLPTKASAHQPPNNWAEELESLYGQAALDVTSGLSGKNIDTLLARIKRDGWPLVAYAWELMLEIRSFEGLNKTTAANVFLKEYASWIMRAKKTPKIDLVAIRARTDRQIESDRIDAIRYVEEKRRKEESELANIDAWLPEGS